MSPTKLSRIEGPVRVALAFNDARNRHDVPAMLALMTEDCRLEPSDPPASMAGYQGHEAIGAYWQRAFSKDPGLQFDVEHLMGLGFRCILQWRRHSPDASFRRGVDLFTIHQGKIREQLAYAKETSA